MCWTRLSWIRTVVLNFLTPASASRSKLCVCVCGCDVTLTRQLLSSSAVKMIVPHFFPGIPLGDKTGREHREWWGACNAIKHRPSSDLQPYVPQECVGIIICLKTNKTHWRAATIYCHTRCVKPLHNGRSAGTGTQAAGKATGNRKKTLQNRQTLI